MDMDEKQYSENEEIQNESGPETGLNSQEQPKDSPVPTDRKTVLAGMFREWDLELRLPPTATPRSEAPWYSSARRNCLSTHRETGVTY